MNMMRSRIQRYIGATVFTGDGAQIENGCVEIRNGKFSHVSAATAAGTCAIGSSDEDVEIIDVRGKYLIPGLMDSNVHLIGARNIDLALEYEGKYDRLALDGAQLALKYGVTTVFDTWGSAGPLRDLKMAIDAGAETGARVFFAGNILGIGGPLSPDFWDSGTLVSRETVSRINSYWERGTGPELACMTISELGDRVAEYIETCQVDFIKYGATDHRVGMYHLLFSESAQAKIVEVSRAYGKRVQAHAGSVESLRIELELELDLLQHGDVTAMRPIPDELLDRIVEKQIPTSVMLATTEHQRWYADNASGMLHTLRPIIDQNDRQLIARGAKLMMMTDGFPFGKKNLEHPGAGKGFAWEVPDVPFNLGRGHFSWLKAADERGMAPESMLRSASLNVAEAYGVSDTLGSIAVGKIADMVVLNDDPMRSVSAYGAIHAVVKDGIQVDRSALCADLEMADDPGEWFG